MYCNMLCIMLYLIHRITHPKLQTKRIDCKMKIADTDFTKKSYKLYKKMYDYENGTDYSKQHYERYEKHVETDDTDVVQPIKRIDYNDGKQRNIIGNYNDNNVNIEKCFNHLNALKRSMTISHETDNENKKLFHENIMFRELLSLELSLRTMKTNIKRENENE